MAVGAAVLLVLSLLGCTGESSGDFIGSWASAKASVTISRNGRQFLLEYWNADLNTVDKFVASYSDDKLTTSVPLIGQTSLNAV
jgi:hypothetical protein